MTAHDIMGNYGINETLEVKRIAKTVSEVFRKKLKGEILSVEATEGEHQETFVDVQDILR